MISDIQNWLDVQERRFHKALGILSIFISGDKRPTSHPYISGDSFRKLADHIHDETGTFQPNDVKQGEIVFVRQSEIHTYLDTIHREIPNPYILIVHNGDSLFDQAVCEKIDDKIIHCFAQVVTYQHPRVTPIPIGLANKYYFLNGLTWLFDDIRKKMKNKPTPKKRKIFYSFSIVTNPTERNEALSVLKNLKTCVSPNRILNPIRYAHTLARYMFVASPRGASIESCRTWEALYVGTIPIVKDYVATNHFKKIGLPLFIIKDWNDIKDITEEELATKYTSIMKDAKFDALYMDYWEKQINDKRNAFTHERN